MNNNTEDAQIVTKDYFLYSCFEFEKTSKAIPRKIKGEGRWPLSKENRIDYNALSSDKNEYERLLRQMLGWYAKQYPPIVEDAVVDYDNLVAIVPPVIMIALDLAMIFEVNTDSKPDSLKNPTSHHWTLIEDLFREKFPQHQDYFLSYLKWGFIIRDEEKVFEIGDRPPVNRYAPNAFRGGARGGAKGPNTRSPRDVAPRRDSSPRGGQRDSSPRGRQRDSASRGGRRDAAAGGPRDVAPRSQGTSGQGARTGRFGKENSEPRRPMGPRRDQPGSRDLARPQRGSDPKLEREARKAVLVAIQALNDDPNLNEYKLQPMNSYYRRLQHKWTIDEGMTSTSTGEGTDRTVIVMRKS